MSERIYGLTPSIAGKRYVAYSMIFSSAQQEFQIRYYQWATTEWEKEIDQSFSSLRLFQSGAAWKTFKFMQGLSQDRQLILAHSLLKRFHPEAVKAMGETCLGEEDSLRYGLDEFRRNPSGLDVEIITKNRPKEGVKFWGKRKLLNKIAQKFQDAFKGQCSESERVLKGDPQLEFKKVCSGWYIFTHFWFGRREGLIDYGHAIANEAFVMGSMMSFCSWLGISSQTQWEHLSDENVDQACDAAIKLCGRFFEVAPKLLKGLEFDKITGK